MKNPSCTEAQAELPLFVGGDLDSEVSKRVERHIEHCADCRDGLAAARTAHRVLHEYLVSPIVELHQPEIWSGVRAGLLERGLIRSPAGTSAPQARASYQGLQTPATAGRLLRLLPLAAAAAAGLFYLGLLAGRSGPMAPAFDPSGDPASQLLVQDPPGPRAGSDLARETLPGALPLGTLAPLAKGQLPLGLEAEPWLGEALPLHLRPGAGASAAGFQSPYPKRADGVR